MDLDNEKIISISQRLDALEKQFHEIEIQILYNEMILQQNAKKIEELMSDNSVMILRELKNKITLLYQSLVHAKILQLIPDATQIFGDEQNLTFAQVLNCSDVDIKDKELLKGDPSYLELEKIAKCYEDIVGSCFSAYLPYSIKLKMINERIRKLKHYNALNVENRESFRRMKNLLKDLKKLDDFHKLTYIFKHSNSNRY